MHHDISRKIMITFLLLGEYLLDSNHTFDFYSVFGFCFLLSS